MFNDNRVYGRTGYDPEHFFEHLSLANTQLN